MPRFAIELAYDGTRYHGWQIQDNAITVQGVIEECLSKQLHQPIQVVGCGRTDTGVHASNYVAHFDVDTLPDNFIFKINRFLPNDIAFYSIRHVSDEFHARFSASSRTYKYYIHFRKDPFLKHSYYLHQELDIEKMNQAAQSLVGRQDFTSFSKLHTQTKTNECTVEYAKFEKMEHQLIFTIRADRFLRNMVRAVVGTLLEVGEDKKDVNHVSDVIKAKNRDVAGRSVPGHALFLHEIIYPQEFFG